MKNTLSCGLGIAELASLARPTNGFDSLAHQVTASFCSMGSGRVYLARYILDLPAGARGGFKVVALDPTDPDARRVLQSQEVVFNGGLEARYPPQILRTETVHQSTDYELRVYGSGLYTVQQAWLVAADSSWEVPLAISSLSDTELQATASLAAWVPDCWVRVQTDSGAVAAQVVSADPPPPPLGETAACQDRFIEDIYPPAMIQPKDFAFVPGGWSATGSWVFHLFYIRQNQVINGKPGGPGFTEKNLGHAVSNDLHLWTVMDTAAISVRPGRWDSFHVWAPTVVRNGIKYYMFYTGVDGSGTQRIGRATSLDLIHWNQEDSVLTLSNAGYWVDQTKQELRDPFVMEDPDAPGQWLMYFTARTNITSFPGMAAGFVRSTNVTFAPGGIIAGGALWATQQNRQSGLESPHLFQRAGRWWLFFTKPLAPLQDTLYALSTASSPTDTVTGDWSPIRSIRDIVPLNEATAYTFWHGSEYLKFAGLDGGKEYFAGWNDSDQSLTYTQMGEATSPYLFTGECPSALDVGDHGAAVSAPGIRLKRAAAGLNRVDLEISLPAAEGIVVVVHDVLGRRVRVVARGQFPEGLAQVSWDGTDEGGSRVRSGIYFVKLTCSTGGSSVRVVFVR